MEERKPRKLLVASIGVATLVYAACSSHPYGETSGNLMPPADTGASDEDVGFDVGTDSGSDTSAQDSSSKDSNDDG